MPQDDTRTENLRGENGAAKAWNAAFGEFGTGRVKAGLRAQKQMLDVFHDISRDWFERATADAELAFKLPNTLTSAATVSDAMSAYNEWLSEWMNKCSEDGRQFISNGQKIVDTGVRCFAAGAPSVART
jgi:hypothetical protein